MKNPTENVAIYWGAFNPPTLAHAQVIQEVLQHTSIDHIILNPSGEREDKTFGISPENRKNIMKIFCKVLRDSWRNISLETYFLEGKYWGLTTTTAEEKYFREQLWVSPSFIYGTDVAPNMSSWSQNKNRFIQERLKKIFIKRPWFEFDFQANGFREYSLLDIPHMLDISSTVAREMIQNKQSVEGGLFPEIIREIEQQKLYQ